MLSLQKLYSRASLLFGFLRLIIQLGWDFYLQIFQFIFIILIYQVTGNSPLNHESLRYIRPISEMQCKHLKKQVGIDIYMQAHIIMHWIHVYLHLQDIQHLNWLI